MQSSLDLFHAYPSPPDDLDEPYFSSSSPESEQNSPELGEQSSSHPRGETGFQMDLDTGLDRGRRGSTGGEPYTHVPDAFSISQTFHADMSPTPDVTFLSSDGVIFFVCLEMVQQRCPEAFQSFLGAAPTREPLSIFDDIVILDYPSEELKIILHALYNLPLGSYKPTSGSITSAIDQMPGLGIAPARVLPPTSALYKYILSYTPLRPLDVYALAARYEMHALAVHASSYLLNLDIKCLSDETCVRMGPLYLMKLIRLHGVRLEALKVELLVAPVSHPPARVDRCSFGQQQQTKHIWALFCAEPMWQTSPIDLAIQSMEGVLQPMMESLRCPECRLTLRKMVTHVRVQWLSVP